MLLAEAIQAQPIWIINNGIAHEDAVPTIRIGSMVQDALDALDFIMGPSDSPWGAVRASMGHPEPWSMHFLGVGNEVGLLCRCVHCVWNVACVYMLDSADVEVALTGVLDQRKCERLTVLLI